MLGRWTRQYITINNPSDDGMDIEIFLENKEGSCFSIDLPLVPIANESQRLQLVSVAPKSSMEIPIQFMPNTLGLGNHRATGKSFLLQKRLLHSHYEGSGIDSVMKFLVQFTNMKKFYLNKPNFHGCHFSAFFADFDISGT